MTAILPNLISWTMLAATCPDVWRARCRVKTVCYYIWAVTCDFQQCGILTSVDSYEPEQPLFNLRSSKRCSVSSLTVIEYSSNLQRLWSDCAFAQAGLSLCWLQIPHCCKFHALAHIWSWDLYWIYNRWPLDIYNGPPQAYSIKPDGRIQK